LLEPEKYGVAGRLTSAISDQLGAHSPRKVRARDFNLASERYYRTVLRRENIDEAFEALSNDFKEIRKSWWEIDEASRESLGICFPDEDPTGFLEKMREGVRNGHAAPADTAKVVKLLLIGIHVDSQRANERLNSERNHDFDSTPLCGSGNRNNP
jgi:hypothetical protein